ILDADGRIVAVLLGRPETADWDQVIAEMERVFEGVRLRSVARSVFKPKARRHRRGDFYVLKGGVTRGPGQKRPGNLAHSKPYRELLHLILSNRSVGRIGGFQSSGLARYFPKLYRYYHSTFRGLRKAQRELNWPFANSIFPTATFNLGPDVVTPEHLVMLNLAQGMCAVTSGGRFNHKTGGHIYMGHLKLICEFPSGSTVLLPSGTCRHGNTPIGKGETRYSMTQYAAGALFRWAAYGYQSATSLGAGRKQEIDSEHATVRLLSTVQELEGDRREVFMN
ncbi:hypothetical protein K438DRAFT_1603652, partial [Mycena galopus ATCC 62051]